MRSWILMRVLVPFVFLFQCYISESLQRIRKFLDTRIVGSTIYWARQVYSFTLKSRIITICKYVCTFAERMGRSAQCHCSKKNSWSMQTLIDQNILNMRYIDPEYMSIRGYEWRIQNCKQTASIMHDLSGILYMGSFLSDLLNTLRPRQNGRYFPDDIFKCIL